METHLDLSFLEKLRGLSQAGGPDVAVTVIELFLSAFPNRLKILAETIEHGTPIQVSREAHRLKSSAGNVGAIQLSAHLSRLEENTNNPQAPLNLESLRQLLTAIQTEYLTVASLLRPICEKSDE